MRNIEGVIFDWAGTTVDFGCFGPIRAFLEIFHEAGVEVGMDEARAPMGMLKRDHIRAMLNMPQLRNRWENAKGHSFRETDIDELYARFEPILLASLAEYTEPLPDVAETVNAVREMGLKIGSTTGYTDAMMEIVTAGARKKGYSPDYWITPDSVGSCGRPYPYMIFRNMEALRLKMPWHVVKVGDTTADIQEGKSAGVWSVGVAVGSSQMGLTQSEFSALADLEKVQAAVTVERVFLASGADFVIPTIHELPGLLNKIDDLVQQGTRPGGQVC